MENIEKMLENDSIGLDVESKLMINPHLRIIFTSSDEILVKHSARSPFSRVIRDEGQTKLIGRLLRSLSGPATMATLIKAMDISEEQTDSAIELAQYLVDEKVLINPEFDVVQLYLDTIIGASNTLAEQSVALIGCGFLGKRFAQQLLELGVGNLTLIDDRKVSEPKIEARLFGINSKNLKKGKAYTECVKNHLDLFGLDTKISCASGLEDEEKLKKAFGAHDLVVVVWECLSSKFFHTVNKVSIDTNKPWLLVHTDGSEAYVGTFFIPGESACYSEYEVQCEASALGVKDEYLTYKESLDQIKLDSAPLVLPCYMDMAAATAATAVMHFMCNDESFLVGRCVRHDFERLTVDYEEVLRLPRCPACAPYRPYRHSFL